MESWNAGKSRLVVSVPQAADQPHTPGEINQKLEQIGHAGFAVNARKSRNAEKAKTWQRQLKALDSLSKNCNCDLYF